MAAATSKHIYCIPGMGFDRRIFDRIDLGSLGVHFIEWIEPEGGESLTTYARRMAAGMSDESAYIIGYSFGGILAQEVAAFRPVDRILLLSSIKSREELSPLFRRVAHWRLEALFNKSLALTLLPLWGWNHGLSRAEVAFFKDMLQKHSNHYFQWGLRAISSWRPAPLPDAPRLTHIHGTNDRPFPYKYLGPVDHTIEGGDHLMIWKHPGEVQALFKRVLSE